MLLAMANPRSSRSPRIWLRGAVIDHPLPGAMQGLDVLLLGGLLGDEGNLGLARGRTDRLGVIAVVLLSADKWLHILRADDLHLMTQFLALARQ
jgi:hypothetical protein